MEVPAGGKKKQLLSMIATQMGITLEQITESTQLGEHALDILTMAAVILMRSVRVLDAEETTVGELLKLAGD